MRACGIRTRTLGVLGPLPLSGCHTTSRRLPPGRLPTTRRRSTVELTRRTRRIMRWTATTPIAARTLAPQNWMRSTTYGLPIL
ncbi:hypothetical protein BOTBODRAFT_38138 [Botryobasidium botryosum FD-172 SS1]|uniref:Uncharacterized protein n=1 Tax=Botryobasidium botryosum (strain FD-172 SS1) TaxID=930990 RepID=A0A067LY32_BOTB1|nr:hypothetical protein BOTBODRAFT_38138 [Botryobasidium botryosum FD-172 SS1]